MDQTCTLIVLLYSSLVVGPAAGVDCIYKECICAGTAIVCEARELTRMPTMVPSSGVYEILNLDVNAITTIPAGSLPFGLTAIHLDNNPITVIEDTALDGSTYFLETLSFSSAQFTKIPNALGHLAVLKDLTISDTQIEDWNEEVMKNIGQSVTKLYLVNVGLTTWPMWIQYFPLLIELSIDRGSLFSIPDDALDNVTQSLTTLSLAQNNLTLVPKALSKLKVLEILYMQDNKIIDVSWLPHGSKLSLLVISSNKISDAKHLSDSLQPFGSSLSSLSINDNLLTSIPNFTFLALVEEIDFSYNKISDPFSGSAPPVLTMIYFSHNSLPAIPRFMSTVQMVSDLVVSWNSITATHETDFPPSTTLVDLGYNLISEITDTSFPEFSQIENIQLNNNPIVRISFNAFANMHRLTELNLQNTKLTRMPLALKSLFGLITIDLSDNTDLVCTCMEKALQQWILTLPPSYVIGTCGLAGIYDFFLNLSPDCP